MYSQDNYFRSLTKLKAQIAMLGPLPLVSAVRVRRILRRHLKASNQPEARWGRQYSPLAAFLVLTAFAVHAYWHSADIEDYASSNWQLILLLLALAVISPAISAAFSVADRFIEDSESLLANAAKDGGTLGKTKSFCLRFHKELLESSMAAVVGVMFAGLALAIVLLLPQLPWDTRLLYALTVCLTFYYAGFGLWSIWIVTQAVYAMAVHAEAEDALNTYHGDCQAGLSFVQTYADVATLFMLIGVLALPAAVFFGGIASASDSTSGSISFVLILLAVAVWAVFTFMSSLRGRFSLALVLRRHKQTALDRIAIERKEVLESSRYDAAKAEKLDARETLALRIRTGLFSGAGAWKDLFGLTASVLTLVETVAPGSFPGFA